MENNKADYIDEMLEAYRKRELLNSKSTSKSTNGNTQKDKNINPKVKKEDPKKKKEENTKVKKEEGTKKESTKKAEVKKPKAKDTKSHVKPISKEDEKLKQNNKTTQRKDEKIKTNNKTTPKEDTKLKTKSKPKKKKIKKVSKKHSSRYTEKKDRNIIERLILQSRLKRGDYSNIEYYYNALTKEDCDKLKESKEKKDVKFYKKVQAYEDAKEDVTAKVGWYGFKVGLVALLLSATLSLGYSLMSTIKNDIDYINRGSTAVSVEKTEETDESQREALLEYVSKLKEDIIEADGFHFEVLSDNEIADAYNNIFNYEKKITENHFRSACFNLSQEGDQLLLDEIISESLGKKYYTLTNEQKEEYMQLAFELLPYASKDVYAKGPDYVRNPIVMKSLYARQDAEKKGYYIRIQVNSDRKETVRNLGNIIHLLKNMSEEEYIAAGENNETQESFYNEILKSVMSEEEFKKLQKQDKRDYKQLIYEFLPSTGKQYIKDPIEVEKAANENNIIEEDR